MENIIAFVLGIVFVVIGITQTKGNLSLLHSYHYKRVKEQDKPIFGKLVGIGSIIIGVGMIFASGSFYLATLLTKNIFEILGYVFLVLGLLVGLIISFYAMIKYNKGIF